MACMLCYTNIEDDTTCIRASCVHHHKFHPGCAKLKYSLLTAEEAAKIIKVKCPVCLENSPVGMLDALQKRLDQLDKLDVVTKKLEKLDKLDQLDKLDDLQKSTNELHGKFDELSIRIGSLETRVSKLESDTSGGCSKEVAEKISKAASILVDCNFEQRALQLESQVLENELSISGLLETANEDLNGIVGHLFGALEVSFMTTQVRFARRIGKPSAQRTGSANLRQRDVLIKFDSKDAVDSLITNAKSKVIAGDFVGYNASLGPVRLHRRHPRALYKLRQLILKSYPRLPAQNVWIMGHAVCIRLSPESSPLRLLPSSGMEGLKNKLSQ
ncbi:GSCOCG00012221001-RA-CDS [Cotesia congregata]|nr:GSCOCG00012221001-RA-CDS [Cotesia congregata]